MRPLFPFPLIAAAALAACTEASAPDEAPLPDQPVEKFTLAGEWRSTPPGPGDSGCFAEQSRPAVVETVTEQVLVQPEMRDPSTGEVTRPAAYRTTSHAKIVQGAAKMWFPAPCSEAMTPEFVASLQRALQVRGLYTGAVTGTLDESTHKAIRAYQRPRGLFSATLSTRAAQELGLVPWL